MRRRAFITLLSGTVLWPVTLRGQQTFPVVTFVFSGIASSGAAPYVTAFKLGLEAVGFIEGQNVAVEYHLPGGHDEGLPALMAEFVHRRGFRHSRRYFPSDCGKYGNLDDSNCVRDGHRPS
jgi:putative tryptophan/tyrosine transport system substrate-binding protein